MKFISPGGWFSLEFSISKKNEPSVGCQIPDAIAARETKVIFVGSGTLLKVLQLLKEANIQLVASTIADTVEYGIYRIICSEPARAYNTLKDAGISVALSDVFALILDNQPGRAADAIKILTDEGIGITYMYSFLLAGKGILIFRTDDNERTRETIILNDLAFITDKDLLLQE